MPRLCCFAIVAVFDPIRVSFSVPMMRKKLTFVLLKANAAVEEQFGDLN